VAELPAQKVYGPMDPLAGSMVEYFDIVVERGNHNLYKNEAQLMSSERRRTE